MNQENTFINWIDELYGTPAQPLAGEHLVSLQLAVTINLPYKNRDYKNLSLIEKINIYKDLFNTLILEYNAKYSHYQIEYTQKGEPHLHGIVEMRVLPEILAYDTKEILRMVARTIFLKLPKNCFKQWSNAKINEYFGIFDSPAVYLKLPKILSQGWTDYIEKNAR